MENESDEGEEFEEESALIEHSEDIEDDIEKFEKPSKKSKKSKNLKAEVYGLEEEFQALEDDGKIPQEDEEQIQARHKLKAAMHYYVGAICDSKAKGNFNLFEM
jgi:hypothetical protein